MGPAFAYLHEPITIKDQEDGENRHFKFAACSMQGWRKMMEDATLIKTALGGDPQKSLFAVFDGHGGPEVAEFAKRHFPTALLQSKFFDQGEFPQALHEACLAMDEQLRSEEGRKEIRNLSMASQAKQRSGSYDFDPVEDDSPEMKGCTANIVLIINKEIFVANVGDSRAVLIDEKGTATALSVDHKPDLESERTRVEKAGGSVFNGRVEGNLSLSRAFGDLMYKSDKKLKPEEQKIIAAPEITRFKLDSTTSTYPSVKHCEYIFIGCDGVYEKFSNQDIANLLMEKFKKAENANKMSGALAELLDANISKDCLKSGGAGCDNMSTILIRFKH